MQFKRIQSSFRAISVHNLISPGNYVRNSDQIGQHLRRRSAGGDDGRLQDADCDADDANDADDVVLHLQEGRKATLLRLPQTLLLLQVNPSLTKLIK